MQRMSPNLEQFGSLYPKGVIISDAARECRTTRRTAEREEVKVGSYDRIQLDEHETCEQTRLKPIPSSTQIFGVNPKTQPP